MHLCMELWIIENKMGGFFWAAVEFAKCSWQIPHSMIAEAQDATCGCKLEPLQRGVQYYRTFWMCTTQKGVLEVAALCQGLLIAQRIKKACGACPAMFFL